MLDVHLLEKLDYLKTSLRAQLIKTSTHHSIIITGLSSEQHIIECLSVYMVGLIANAIQANLSIRNDLLEEGIDGIIDLEESIFELIGESNNLNRDFIEDERNPWLAESIIHLLLTIANDVENLHPAGEIIAVGLVHDDPKDKGLDLTALYLKGNIGLTIGECKAYKLYPNKAVSKAVGFFDGIDENKKMGKRIRTQVQIMRQLLSSDLSSMVTHGFWRQERCFLTSLIYDNSIQKDWSKARRSMQKLNVPVDKRIIIPIYLDDFSGFFDKLSDEMRDYVRSLKDV
ncbi:hypothetical protein [Fictibacillus sp. S7]|uniref:hypothetical protein n=1 Tax=Fictibacillus sp. S7 TaxID=2212476 RepID=UPI001010ABFA|nr:hypothetical protein [Fictibacillus sp. S7]RXY99180.1 hypothetical protein DMO16_05610 [Fictibacillus sp. S7]